MTGNSYRLEHHRSNTGSVYHRLLLERRSRFRYGGRCPEPDPHQSCLGLIKDGLLDLHLLRHLNVLPQLRRWNPALKIVLSVGGWGAGGFSAMAMTEEGHRAFARSCLAAASANS